MNRMTDYLIGFAALMSFLFSVVLWFAGHREEGQYVSVWVPTILILGVYLRTFKKKA